MTQRASDRASARPSGTIRSFGRAAGVLAGVASTVLLVSLAVFVAVEMLPGDGATYILGQNATPARVDALRAQLGLDRPVLVRYIGWLADVVRGDLGTTLTGRPVLEVIRSPLVNTAVLVAVSMCGTAVVAVGLGLVSGRRAGGRADGSMSTASLLVVSVPDHVVATVALAVLGVWLGVVPTVSLVPAGGTPLDRPSILVVPALAISLTAGCFGGRLIRSIVVDAAARPHVEAARFGGVAEAWVVVRHIVPTVAGGIVRTLALLLPYLAGGTVVAERIVGYPGLGTLLVGALTARDVRTVEAVVLVTSVVVVAGLTAADVVARRLDARLGGSRW